MNNNVPLACSFCRQPQSETRVLITGSGAHICDQCVGLAEEVISSGQAAETALGPLRGVSTTTTAQQRCDFCGKRRHQVRGMAMLISEPAGDVAVCTECLALCREIISEQWP